MQGVKYIDWLVLTLQVHFSSIKTLLYAHCFFINPLKTMLELQSCSVEDTDKENTAKNGCTCNILRIILCS